MTTINDIINWFKNINENIIKISTNLMNWSYDAITNVVLHTPVFLFDNEWFKSSTLTFTGLSIAMSMMLLIYEGFQKMTSGLFNKSGNGVETTEDMGRVSSRIPFVIIGSAFAPSAFYYGFKGLNYVTEKILDIGKTQINNNMNFSEFNGMTLLEILSFIGFDLALIGMMIPVLLQNFRRWADILMLGAITPLALSCWMFKSQEHLFRKWWEAIKKSSLTQLVYAVFLLVIGTLMFGIKAPDNVLDMLIKMGIIIGCLWRMNTLPSFVRSYVDNGKDVNDVKTDINKGFKKTAGYFSKFGGVGGKIVNKIKKV